MVVLILVLASSGRDSLMPAPNAGAGQERRECPKPRQAPAPQTPRLLVPYHGRDDLGESVSESMSSLSDPLLLPLLLPLGPS